MNYKIINTTRLKDGRTLSIRRPAPEDATEMVALLNMIGGESDNLGWGANQFHISIEQETEYIKNSNADIDGLMLVGIVDKKIISVAAINAAKRVRVSHNSEVSISVKRELWGLGVGTGIMLELIAFAKRHPVIRNVHLLVRSSNERGIRLYEKVGFKTIGVYHNYMCVNGKYLDCVAMEMDIFDNTQQDLSP